MVDLDEGKAEKTTPKQPVAGPSRRTRTRTGCLVCRYRGVKCDLGKPECTRCVNYGAECVYAAKKVYDSQELETRLRKGKREKRTSAHAFPLVDAEGVVKPLELAHNIGTPAHALQKRMPHMLESSMDKMGPMEILAALCRSTRMAQFFVGPTEPPDFLRTAFPGDNDLRCFHHCITYTLSMLVVDEDHNPWVEDVAPLFLFPAAEAPLAAEALKQAMLAVGAAHLSYLHARGSETALGDASKELSTTYRTAAVRLLRAAAVIGSEIGHDGYLAACTALITHAVFAADPSWREVFRLALRSIRARGGVAKMLFGDSGTQSPSRLRRCIVEQLALCDVFRSLTVREPCALLGPESHWWELLAVNSMPGLDSFEALAGMDRGIIRLAARVLGFLPAALQHVQSILPDAALPETSLLLHDMNQWYTTVATTILAARTRTGSLTMWHALNIILLRYYLERGLDDQAVQLSARSILEILEAAGDKIEYLNWSLIVACSVLVDPAQRAIARGLLDLFAYQCCYELQVIRIIVEECWKRMDQGADCEGCSWWEILHEMGIPVLLG